MRAVSSAASRSAWALSTVVRAPSARSTCASVGTLMLPVAVTDAVVEALPAGTTGTAWVVPAAAVSSTVLAAAGRPIVTSSPEEAAITAERRR